MRNIHQPTNLIDSQTITEIEQALEKSWCLKTCYPPDRLRWSKDNKAIGQCQSTTLLICNIFGGKIAYDKPNFHLWNVLPDGSEHDFTRLQFKKEITLSATKYKSVQEVLGSDDAKAVKAKQRYELLKLRFEKETSKKRRHDISLPKTKDILTLLNNLVIPMAKIKRASLLPFDLSRNENSAEHSFILSVTACALAERTDPTLNLGKVAQLALLHDLIETYTGDIPIYSSKNKALTKETELAALSKLRKEYGKNFPWIEATIIEYKRLDSKEARFVYALDKIIPHAIVVLGNRHHVKPKRKDYLRLDKERRLKLAKFPKLIPYYEDLHQTFQKSPHFFRD
jgi:putative hydrolase of HD superfamily